MSKRCRESMKVLVLMEPSHAYGPVLRKCMAEHALRVEYKSIGSVEYIVGNDVNTLQPLVAEVDAVVHAVFAGGKAGIIEALWSSMPNVQWIHSLSAGVDGLVPTLRKCNGADKLPVSNAKGAFDSSLAEWCLAAFLHFNKQVVRIQQNRAAKVWDKFEMSELRNKTVGFVGFGSIAQTTLKLCRAFGCQVLALRRRVDGPGSELADQVYDYAGKLEFFGKCDFVVCSLPGTPETYHFCGAEAFEAMKSTAVFVSIGRGSCVDEAALEVALRSNSIAGAALDVFEKEPLTVESPLWDCENLLLTAHNADNTSSYIDDAWGIYTSRFDSFCRNEEFPTVGKENLVPEQSVANSQNHPFHTASVCETAQSMQNSTPASQPVGQLFDFSAVAGQSIFQNHSATAVPAVAAPTSLFGSKATAPAQSLFPSTTAPASSSLRPCAQCNNPVPKKQFSSNQWAKGLGMSRCKSCIKANASTSAVDSADDIGLDDEAVNAMAEALRNLSCGEDEEDEDDEDEDDEDDEVSSDAGDSDEESTTETAAVDEPQIEQVNSTFRSLSSAGVPVLDPERLTFVRDSCLGEGGNGTVCLGTALLDDDSLEATDVAIKTVYVGGTMKQLTAALKEFHSEVEVGYKAGLHDDGTNMSRLCRSMGAAFEVNTKARKKKRSFKLYLLMDRISSNGDLHDAVIHESSNWQGVRVSSKDTGARCGPYFSVDSDGDVFNYVMTSQFKLKLAEEVVQSLLQLQKRGVVHLDIKPSNLLFTDDRHLKLIDFGEAVMHTADGQLEFTAGTPGYMAPEVVYGEADYSADVYSAGITLLELWVGSLWGESKESTAEDEMMEIEINKALNKVQSSEPKIAQLLRACLCEEPSRRCSAKKLLKTLKELRTQSGKPIANTNKIATGKKHQKRNKKR